MASQQQVKQYNDLPIPHLPIDNQKHLSDIANRVNSTPVHTPTHR